MGHGRVGLFVQVRLGSRRLPRKALLPLGGSTLIEQVMLALRGVSCDVRALLTDAESETDLRGPAGRGDFHLFVGPGEDVLARYVLAADRWGVDTVVRATGDNPLVSAALARAILAEHDAAGADLTHYLGCPLGTGVEVIRADALRDAHRRCVSSAEREHISTYLYRHAGEYRIHEPRAAPDVSFPDATVSVDTREDYERVLSIYADVGDPPIEAQAVVAWLKSHRDRVALMRIVY